MADVKVCEIKLNTDDPATEQSKPPVNDRGFDTLKNVSISGLSFSMPASGSTPAHQFFTRDKIIENIEGARDYYETPDATYAELNARVSGNEVWVSAYESACNSVRDWVKHQKIEGQIQAEQDTQKTKPEKERINIGVQACDVYLESSDFTTDGDSLTAVDADFNMKCVPERYNK